MKIVCELVFQEILNQKPLKMIKNIKNGEEKKLIVRNSKIFLIFSDLQPKMK